MHGEEAGGGGVVMKAGLGSRFSLSFGLCVLRVGAEMEVLPAGYLVVGSRLVQVTLPACDIVTG